MANLRKVIALEARLRDCSNVITLGVKPNFSDYSREDADLIRNADKIYFPTGFYADLFDTVGKDTFPSYHTYKCVQDKIKQTALFTLADIPHPRTRVFYGKRQHKAITEHFKFPFIAKVARGSSMGRGIYLIKDRDELKKYLDDNFVAYIQEYFSSDRDIRAVVIGKRVVHAYWRIAGPGEFRSNLATGGSVCFDHIPVQALDLARRVAEKCRWDNVGIDILKHKDRFYVLEANMKYGRDGFRKAGIDYTKLMEQLIENGEI